MQPTAISSRDATERQQSTFENKFELVGKGAAHTTDVKLSSTQDWIDYLRFDHDLTTGLSVPLHLSAAADPHVLYHRMHFNARCQPAVLWPASSIPEVNVLVHGPSKNSATIFLTSSIHMVQYEYFSISSVNTWTPNYKTSTQLSVEIWKNYSEIYLIQPSTLLKVASVFKHLNWKKIQNT
jgi:hypothetical protein